jgi:hypothetical protein
MMLARHAASTPARMARWNPIAASHVAFSPRASFGAQGGRRDCRRDRDGGCYGWLAILIAAITSRFVARAESERAEAETADDEPNERLGAQVDDLRSRLERVEQMLTRLTDGS